jgi:3-oxoacyl-[acyl-carrier protein] reductase
MTTKVRLVLISGASRGLGAAIAKDLCADHEVWGFARSREAPFVAPSFRYQGGVDVCDFPVLQKLESELGAVDVLINNVGIAYDGILATQSLESIESTLQTNLTSVLYLTKLYLRARLTKRLPGDVITISSVIGTRGFAGLAAYSASKGGLDAMTRALAREMGPKGFRFNNVLPGYFESELSRNLTAEKRAMIERRTPLGRLATIDDIVPVVRFLASDASRFITGQTLAVDGGLTN